MKTRALARPVASAVAVLCLTWFMPAAGARAGGAAEAACAADRDSRLAALEEEALSVAVTFDNDAAVAESPEYQLLKDKDALLRDIAAEKQAVRERYRLCAAGAGER
jgi:hypothetical protein